MREDRRRRFLLGSGALLAAPLRAFAQMAPQKRRIGILIPGTAIIPANEKTFQDELARFGFEEGKNLIIERRFADGNLRRLPELARDLVRLDVELIVAISNSSAFAARSVTTTVPIVATMGKPVENGLIKSYARPGGNITGTDFIPTTALEQKCMEILKAAVPGAKRVARLWYTVAFNMALYGDAYEKGILEQTGLALTSVDVTRAEDLDGALNKIAASLPDVLYVYGHEFFYPHYTRIAAFAASRKLVSISELPQYMLAGGMLYYGANSLPMVRRTASYVARILRGAKPGDLPVEQPTEFELVLNRKVSDSMGVTLPQSFLSRVDRVME